MSENRPFDRVKNQIGCCGIWCGSCPGGNGVTQELTKRYEEFVKRSQIEKWAPKDFDFGEFMKGLGSIQSMSLCPGCMEGGGAPECTIRTCAKCKGHEQCNECEQLEGCREFKVLEASLPEIKKGLMQLKRKEDAIEEWTIELARKWPSCVLSCPALKGR
jgi:hypothetical protein